MIYGEITADNLHHDFGILTVNNTILRQTNLMPDRKLDISGLMRMISIL